MLTIEKLILPSVEQYAFALYGMRAPMESWDRSDSWFRNPDGSYFNIIDEQKIVDSDSPMIIGERDKNLAKILTKGGSEESKFLRQLPIGMVIYAPLYWWKEYDTYKIATVSNSSSTMHQIHKRDLTLDDISTDHLSRPEDFYDSDLPMPVIEGPETEHGTCIYWPSDIAELVIKMINKNRKLFNETKEKTYWWNMIQLLGTNYNQRRVVTLNYEVLANMINHRHNHKQDEWRIFVSYALENIPFCSEMMECKNPKVFSNKE